MSNDAASGRRELSRNFGDMVINLLEKGREREREFKDNSKGYWIVASQLS